jgi:hypothetical protein
MIASFRFTAPMSAPMTATDLHQLIERTKRDLDKDPPGHTESFGKELCEAVKQRVHNRPLRAGIVAQSTSSSDESFGEKVTKAVEEQVARRPDTHKAAEQRAEQEGDRYRGIQRRAHTKGE